MTINLAIGPVVSLIAGVLILIVPRLLNYIVAIYLILIGLIGIFGWSGTHIRTADSTSQQRASVAQYAVQSSVDPVRMLPAADVATRKETR
jgi:DUF3096 family protein